PASERLRARISFAASPEMIKDCSKEQLTSSRCLYHRSRAKSQMYLEREYKNLARLRTEEECETYLLPSMSRCVSSEIGRGCCVIGLEREGRPRRPKRMKCK